MKETEKESERVREQVDLRTLGAHVVELTEPLLKRGVAMRHSVAPDVPATIRGDPERIKQARAPHPPSRVRAPW